MIFPNVFEADDNWNPVSKVLKLFEDFENGQSKTLVQHLANLSNCELLILYDMSKGASFNKAKMENQKVISFVLKAETCLNVTADHRFNYCTKSFDFSKLYTTIPREN